MTLSKPRPGHSCILCRLLSPALLSLVLLVQTFLFTPEALSFPDKPDCFKNLILTLLPTVHTHQGYAELRHTCCSHPSGKGVSCGDSHLFFPPKPVQTLDFLPGLLYGEILSTSPSLVTYFSICQMFHGFPGLLGTLLPPKHTHFFFCGGSDFTGSKLMK